MYSIGIFASEYSLHNIMKIDTVLRRQCKVTYFPYTSMEHLIYLYRENAAFLDGMIFGGAFPYHIVHEQMKSSQNPAHFLHFLIAIISVLLPKLRSIIQALTFPEYILIS